MQMYIFVLFWHVTCIFTTYCSVLQPLSSTILDKIQPELSEGDIQFEIVSISNELEELGRDPQTPCPFRVENRTVDLDHPLGNFVIEISEIICSTSCTAQSCGAAGSKCKQLTTDFRLTINNPATEIPENVLVTNMAIGCSCTPEDPGFLGEEVLQR
jgi:hypothetical protein